MPPKPPDVTLDLEDERIQDAGADGPGSGTPEQPVGIGNVAQRQRSGELVQGAEPHTQAGRNGPAAESTVGRDEVDGNSRAAIDDQDVAPGPKNRDPDRGGEPVAPQRMGREVIAGDGNRRLRSELQARNPLGPNGGGDIGGIAPGRGDDGPAAGLPKSLGEALDALEADHDYLTAGGVFPEELIRNWIKLKRAEEEEISRIPTPVEFQKYYTL